MKTVIEGFEERVREIDSYVTLLRRLENPDVIVYNRARRRRVRVFGEDSFKVMKATLFLLLYNLVESSVRGAFDRLYETIVAEGKTLADVRGELQSLWVGQKFRALDYDSASPRNFREMAEGLVDEVLKKCAVNLSAAKLPISGNLDAPAIRKVCRLHGVPERVHHRARGGTVLETVKEQRNALGHGSASFVDCGQQYAVSDLMRIKREAVVFVRSILGNIKRYVENAEYAA